VVFDQDRAGRRVVNKRRWRQHNFVTAV